MTSEERRVVDVHAHFVPETYHRGLLAGGKDMPDGSPIPPWSPATHVEAMDRLGISTAVISLSSPGLDVDGRPEYWAREVNEAGASTVAQHPNRFGWLASLPLPDVDASLAELDRVYDQLHADGIAMLTHCDGVYLGDPRLDPLMAELDRRRAVVFIHPTSPAGCGQVDHGRPAPLIEFVFDTTRAVINLALNDVPTRFPGIRWIVPHNGAALTTTVDRAQMFVEHVLHGSQAVRGSLSSLYYEVGSSAPFPRAAAALLDLVRPDHLVLGTDHPYAPPAAVSANLARLRGGELVSGAALDSLLHGTAENLFPRLAGV